MVSPGKFLSFLNPKRIAAVGEASVREYIESGRIPWSRGYKQYKLEQLENTVRSKEMLDVFRSGRQLPHGYGYAVDERIVEYPWLLSRLNNNDERLLDAGSILNYPYLIENTVLNNKDIVIMTLEPENTMIRKSRLSYMFCDLRHNPFKDEVFDTVVSLSTIEHIGLDNTMIYSDRDKFKEKDRFSYLVAIDEMIRVLKRSGKLYLSVPFGKREFFGWLQQFDSEMIAELCSHIRNASLIEATYYRYDQSGWQISAAESCKDCEYFDTHTNLSVQSDRAAAARAVACLIFQKDAKVNA